MARSLSVFIDAAEKHGAKFHYRGLCFGWVILDQQDNELWHDIFITKLGAARAYCRVHKIIP